MRLPSCLQKWGARSNSRQIGRYRGLSYVLYVLEQRKDKAFFPLTYAPAVARFQMLNILTIALRPKLELT